MLASSVQAVVACSETENLHIHDCIVILSLYAAVYMHTGHVFVGYVHFTHVCVPPDAQPSRLISGQSGRPACGPAVQLDKRPVVQPCLKAREKCTLPTSRRCRVSYLSYKPS